MTTPTPPESVLPVPRARVQKAIEAALLRKISVGIPSLVAWAAAAEVLAELLKPSVSADLDHLIRQERMPGFKNRPPGT